MSKLLTNIALGASAGIAAGGLVYLVEKRVNEGKPVLPSGLQAVARSLDPLVGGALLYAKTALDGLIEKSQHAAGDDSDGGDSAPSDELGLTGPPAGDEANLQDHGHPAGPGFAATPA